MSDLISRQAAITEFNCCELTPDGGIDANYAIEFLEMLPSAQPNVHDFPKDADCISRQQAIDAVLGVIPDDDYWKEQVKKAVFALPSAQPEIIRCKDCNYYYFADNRVEAEQCHVCGYWDFDSPSPNGFCSFAERRTND